MASKSVGRASERRRGILRDRMGAESQSVRCFRKDFSRFKCGMGAGSDRLACEHFMLCSRELIPSRTTTTCSTLASVSVVFSTRGKDRPMAGSEGWHGSSPEKIPISFQEHERRRSQIDLLGALLKGMLTTDSRH